METVGSVLGLAGSLMIAVIFCLTIGMCKNDEYAAEVQGEAGLFADWENDSLKKWRKILVVLAAICIIAGIIMQ